MTAYLVVLLLQTRIAPEQVKREPSTQGTHLTIEQIAKRAAQVSKRCEVKMVDSWKCQEPLSKDKCIKGEQLPPSLMMVCSASTK